MQTHTPQPTAPVPLDDDLECFPRVMISRRVLGSREYLRLKRRSPVAALALVEIHIQAQIERGCGLEDDDCVLMNAAGLDGQDWEELGGLIREHLVKLETGLLYVRMFLEDTAYSYGFKVKRRKGTAKARERRAEKRRAAKQEGEDSPPPEQKAGEAAPASKKEGAASPPPSSCEKAPSGTNSSVYLVPSGSVRSPPLAGTAVPAGEGVSGEGPPLPKFDQQDERTRPEAAAAWAASVAYRQARVAVRDAEVRLKECPPAVKDSMARKLALLMRAEDEAKAVFEVEEIAWRRKRFGTPSAKDCPSKGENVGSR
ncbi:hypothetical protein [Belnapia sp. F-4-1]|uniref:hypothetical protein n=1 Tax=Belnapia sp. F-4-1 TaxID=1545443 RepID=UPI0005BE78ED|nr:hypothetical protein [Belnapia sp. F-4-1]